jgi:hypothetical protein
MKYARMASAGIAPLVERLAAAGVQTGDLTEILWRIAWTRGHDDIEVPIPAPALHAAGFTVFARASSAGEHVTLVDTGAKLLGIIGRGPLPPLGSRVRVSPGLAAGGGVWTVAIHERLGAGLTVRFDRGPDAGQRGWLDAVRAALEAIRRNAGERRTAIAGERRKSPVPAPIGDMPAELRARHAALIARVDAETAPSEAERRTLERASGPVRRSIMADITARRLARYREELRAFQAAIPAVLAERQARIAANVAARLALQALEDDDARARALGERALTACEQLDAIALSKLCVDGFDASAVDPRDESSAAGLIGSVALLFALARLDRPDHRGV